MERIACPPDTGAPGSRRHHHRERADACAESAHERLRLRALLHLSHAALSVACSPARFAGRGTYSARAYFIACSAAGIGKQ
jgi:hypothetical protein